jgi:cytochrome P450
MPYSLFYRRHPYRMICYGVSPWTEIARWVMDRRGVEYAEESHVPMLHVFFVRNSDLLPGLVVPEKFLPNALEILNYWDAHSPASEKLLAGSVSDMSALIDRFYNTTGIAARRWAYFYALTDRKVTLKCWQQGAPAWERVVSSVLFPVMRWIMRKGLHLTPMAPTESMTEIDACFRMIEQRLSDGRRYLMGDTLTAVDIIFAALMGPAILPDGYGGPLPTLDEAPPAMREGVLRLRDTVAGRFVLRLYGEDRGLRCRDGIKTAEGVGAFFSQCGRVLAGSPALLRFGFGLLRHFRPVLLIGRTAVVTHNADVLEILNRDQEFTIAPINEARMDAAQAPFILGWDRSPQYDLEGSILRRALRPADLVSLQSMAARHARACIDAAHPYKRIDVVGGLSRVVPVRVVSEFFGAPGPNEQIMMRWMRVLFWQLFLNRSNDAAVQSTAKAYAAMLHDYLAAWICHSKQDLAKAPDNFLVRLLRMQSEPGDSVDDDGVRRNISGLIVGAVDTTSAAVAQAIDHLLDRPREFGLACAAANAEDLETVSKYVFEALRFNPQTVGLLRFCTGGAKVAVGTDHETSIPPGTTVLLATLSAMFDPEAFSNPTDFRVDRGAPSYLHFGYGMHQCYGRAINRVQIPQIALSLLKLKGLRRATGESGRLAYDGPFPDRMILEFNA